MRSAQCIAVHFNLGDIPLINAVFPDRCDAYQDFVQLYEAVGNY